MENTVIKFAIVVSPDQKAVGVFTPDPVDPKRIVACLDKAAQSLTGTVVVSADFTAFADHGDESSRYVFGTAGVLRFDAPQSPAVLASAQEAVVRAITDGGFEAHAL